MPLKGEYASDHGPRMADILLGIQKTPNIVPNNITRGLNNFAEGAGNLIGKAGDQLTDPNLLLNQPLKRPSLVMPAAMRMMSLFVRDMARRNMDLPPEDRR